MALNRRARLADALTPWPPVCMVTGLAVLWLAEHTLTHAAHRTALGWACGLLATGVALAALRLGIAPRPRRRAYALALRCALRQAWALGLYAACRGKLLGQLGDLTALLQIAWPTLLLRGLMPACAVEYALASMRHAPALEMGRLRLAARAADVVWLSWLSFAAINYAGTLYAKKVDWSYLQATVAGSATKAVVQGLREPVEVVAFFPPGNEVGERVRLYLAELERQNPQLHVTALDHAVAGALAASLDVRGNGTVALRGVRRTERLHLPLEQGRARPALRRLDDDILARLLSVSAPPRRAYVTYGHGEAELAPAPGAAAFGLGQFKRRLEAWGYVVRRLGAAEGLGGRVPPDADMVAILGPRHRLAAGEAKALADYVRGGGRLLLAVGPGGAEVQEARASLAPVLGALGLELDLRPLSNAHFQLQLEGGGAPRYNLLTTEASAHPAVAGLRRRQNRLGLLLPLSGSVAIRPDAAAHLQRTPLVYAMPQTARQADLAAEPAALGPSRVPLAVAVAQAPQDGAANAAGSPLAEAPQLRAVVVANASFASDLALDNPGNLAFVRDACRWLTGDALLGTTTAGVQDLPLVHRRSDDVLWFYGTTFAVPAAVLVLAAYIRGAGRARRPERNLAEARAEVTR